LKDLIGIKLIFSRT